MKDKGQSTVHHAISTFNNIAMYGVQKKYPRKYLPSICLPIAALREDVRSLDWLHRHSEQHIPNLPASRVCCTTERMET